jgi:hypothetical protein
LLRSSGACRAVEDVIGESGDLPLVIPAGCWVVDRVQLSLEEASEPRNSAD